MQLSFSANVLSITKGHALADEALCVCFLTCFVTSTLLMQGDDYFGKWGKSKKSKKKIKNLFVCVESAK